MIFPAAGDWGVLPPIVVTDKSASVTSKVESRGCRAARLPCTRHVPDSSEALFIKVEWTGWQQEEMPVSV